jgi:hypothetical protein
MGSGSPRGMLSGRRPTRATAPVHGVGVLPASPLAVASSRPAIVPASTTSPPISAFVSAQNASTCKSAGSLGGLFPTRLMYSTTTAIRIRCST